MLVIQGIRIFRPVAIPWQQCRFMTTAICAMVENLFNFPTVRYSLLLIIKFWFQFLFSLISVLSSDFIDTRFYTVLRQANQCRENKKKFGCWSKFLAVSCTISTTLYGDCPVFYIFKLGGNGTVRMNLRKSVKRFVIGRTHVLKKAGSLNTVSTYNVHTSIR